MAEPIGRLRALSLSLDASGTQRRRSVCIFITRALSYPFLYDAKEITRNAYDGGDARFLEAGVGPERYLWRDCCCCGSMREV